MSDIAIHIEDVSKQYRIGRKQGSYKTLRDTLTGVFLSPFHWVGKRWRRQLTSAADPDATIWALKNVSCDIKQGEIVGIIGRNGAGKSTLLKILSRITEPTAGFAEIRGHVGSLLEVGTGFHSELTGRENVYLNGAILGMKRVEIKRKFDEMVAFAEVEKFIDTPVKHYSSGMYLRLAFAVAAYLEPQILMVDEVLAVGDVRFFSKCVDRMLALNAQGMTIALVTHNMWLVQTMCSRAVCLDEGRIIAEGDPLKVIGAYRDMNKTFRNGEDDGKTDRQREETAKMLALQIFPRGEWTKKKEAFPDSGITVMMAAQVSHLAKVKFLVRITSPDGFPYFTVYSDLIDASQKGQIECEATISHLMLIPGEYFLWGAICSQKGEKQVLAEEHLPFFVKGDGEATPQFGFFWNQAKWRILN